MDLHRRMNLSQARTEAVEAYLASAPVRGLHLGAGSHVLPGWFNTDIRPASREIHFLDSTARFPFPDGVFDHVFSEHHIEHVTWDRAQVMLAECLRVLRPGGVLRIATPSLEAIAALVTATPTPAQQHYVDVMSERHLRTNLPAGVAGVVNNTFLSWGHQFIYDRPTLLAALADAGFTTPVFTAPGVSEHEHLRGIEGHAAVIGDAEVNALETMVVEATRPEPGIADGS